MNALVALTCLAIIGARIADVSLGTIRVVMIVQGRRMLAWVLGFFEVLIWLFAAAKVLGNLDQPIYAICYALGFATGNYIGLTIEDWLSIGNRAVRIFTRLGPDLASALREQGAGVTEFTGRGREGTVYELYMLVPRRRLRPLLALARKLDPRCFYVIEDAREASSASLYRQESTGWRAIIKKE
jgi:uncharacterized protein YebE (UPF0316 family)